jgi:hypothetical protein
MHIQINMFMRIDVLKIWGHSSVGRAVALQASGRRFDPVWLHHFGAGQGTELGDH